MYRIRTTPLYILQEQRTVVIAKQLEINEVETSLGASIKAVEVGTIVKSDGSVVQW